MQFVRGYTSIYFAENQLSPSLISLSLQSSAHPPLFQQWWVRPSTRCYPRFSLAKDRSLGFGSTACNWRPIWTRFPFGFTYRLNLATYRNSQAHYAKGTRSSIPCGIALPVLVNARFQVLFHSPYRGSFHLSLTVLVHYRSSTSI